MKKLLIIFILPLVLLIGAGAGAFFFGLIPGLGKEIQSEREKNSANNDKPLLDVPPKPFFKSSSPIVNYPMDEFVINLQSKRRKPIFLLLTLVLELSGEEAKSKVTPLEPRIRDAVNIYLSSLTPDQLSGYKGIQMVRREIWRRLRKIVTDKEMLQNIQILKMTVK